MKKQFRAKRDRYYAGIETLDLYDGEQKNSLAPFSSRRDASMFANAKKRIMSRFDGYLVKSRIDKNPSMFGKKYKRKR